MKKINNNIQEKIFIVTDGCMWEKNKQEGTSAPHAIQVVDEETGQLRYIKSGSRIKFLGGLITEAYDQKLYNQKG